MFSALRLDGNRAFGASNVKNSSMAQTPLTLTLKGVFLIDSFEEPDFFVVMNSMARKLWEAEPDPSKRFRVCLLVIDSSFDYTLKFENSDPSKWRITKLDGGTGLPIGYKDLA